MGARRRLEKGAKVAGKLKVWQNRLASYISVVNFVMIFYLYILENPLGLEWWEWAIVIVGSIVSIIFIDIKFIMPSAQSYTFDKNPPMVSLKKKVEKNSERLDEILEILKHNG